MTSQELQKDLARDVRDLGRIKRVRGHFVLAAGERGRKAEHFASLGDVEAQAAAVARVDGELDLAVEDHVDAR